MTFWPPSLPVAALAPQPPSTNAQIALAPIIENGLDHPVFLIHAADDSGHLYIVEQPGRILVIEQGSIRSKPFLDISGKVYFGGERGLLSLAFHPDYPTTHRYFINYTRKKDGATVISEFNANSPTPTEKILLVIPQPYSNHNGGMIAFGPDGFLYIGTGDGGAGGDPENRAQNPSEFLGKLLRIDIDQEDPYAIPADNPYRSGHGRPEIFALGFRNPWRFSFDRATGELWTGDVGQNQWEEIDRVLLGKNYGWRIMEGTHCYLPETGCPQHNLTLPVAEYANVSPRCAITGGYVYRGNHIRPLTGTYLFGDYCSGEIMAFHDGAITILLSTELRISSFGEDEKGELYVVGHKGSIHKIIPP